MNLFPSTIGTDIASTSSSFILNSGVLNIVYLVGGILLGVFILDILVNIYEKKHDIGTTNN